MKETRAEREARKKEYVARKMEQHGVLTQFAKEEAAQNTCAVLLHHLGVKAEKDSTPLATFARLAANERDVVGRIAAKVPELRGWAEKVVGQTRQAWFEDGLLERMTNTDFERRPEVTEDDARFREAREHQEKLSRDVRETAEELGMQERSTYEPRGGPPGSIDAAMKDAWLELNSNPEASEQ